MRVDGTGPEKTLEAMEEALAAGVVADVPGAAGRYTFSHALIRETLHEDLKTTRRVQLHRRIAEGLEDLYKDSIEAHLPELAWHFTEAAPGGDVTKAIAYAKRAGARAMGQLAYEEAARHYERALRTLELEMPVDEGERCELLLHLGEAQNGASEHHEARLAFQHAASIARRRKTAEQLAQAAIGVAWARWIAGTPPDGSIHLLEEALDVLGEEDSPLRVAVLDRLVGEIMGANGERSRSASIEALEMARRIGDPRTLLTALISRRWALWGPDSNIEEQLDAANELAEFAEKHDDKLAAVWGNEARMIALLELGDIESAERAAESRDRWAKELRLAWLTALGRVCRGTFALLRGQFDECERLAVEAWAEGKRLRSGNVIMWAGAQRFYLRRLQGRLEEEEAGAKAAVARFPNSPEFRCVLALLHIELGRKNEARGLFEGLAKNEFSDLPRNFGWLLVIANLSEICHAVSDGARAGRLYELLRPYAAQNVGSIAASYGPAPYHLGLLATTLSRFDEAARHFEDALGRSEWMGAKPFVARTQYDYGQMLLGRGKLGDRERALQLVNQALATARELGMKPLVEKALARKLEAQGVDASPTKTSI
jgi:tetratricopeptide (TPR) repeat protein